MRPLRAYLLMRLPSGDVDVSTHRDLESVETAWQERSSPEAAAALHVGYWRPETEDFVDALKSYPGRVLLSASTVYALPPSCRSSAIPVGFAQSLPLYLALSGWGYEAEDWAASPPEGSKQTGFIATPSPEQRAERLEITCEWLRKLSMDDPSMFEQAMENGVVNEESYLQVEARLPNLLRDSLGEARFRWLCPSPPTAESIFDCIASTPLWFQSLPISILSLSTRPANIISAKSIRRIGDLCQYRSKEVFAFDKMGRKSFNEIGTRLLSVLADGVTSTLVRANLFREARMSHYDKKNDETPSVATPTSLPETEGAETAGRAESQFAGMTNFSEALDVAMGLLTEQERGLMEMRMGAGRSQMTLSEIGDAYGLSRERIRQIETRCVGKMQALFFWSSVMGPRIRKLLGERDDALAPQGLELMEPAFKGAAKSLSVLEYVLERFVEPRMHLVKEAGLTFVTEIMQQEWVDATRATRRLMESLVDKRPTMEEARNMVDSLLVGRGAELRGELWSVATKHAHFANGRLVSYGLGAEPLVLAILESSETPLHYSEILKVLSQQAYEYDSRRIHSAAAEVGLLYSRGTFGTMKHFPLNEAETRLVVSETEDLMEGAGEGRQWHAREICDRLEERGLECRGNLTPYVVSIALARSKHLTYLGRMVWVTKASGARGVANRLDMHQAIVSILMDNGKPMPSDVIKEKLASERGLNCYFQIHPEGQLVRLGAGLWGLMDRDIPFSQDESEHIMAALKAALIDNDKGFHASEIVDEIAKTQPVVRRIEDPVLLLGLAQKFEGFSVSKGQYVYLSSWGEPRRMSVREALQEVLANAGQAGITIQEGMARVADLLERPFPPNMSFGQMSWQLGAVYDELTKRWNLPSEEEIESERA
ncbi:RNA polymerase sigma factor (sigma-70 family) [Cupriavidus alkaliphilus]|uniref:sigma factor-like helix-turn-helix DNA-binding protein n=1 Tax=Cupriavidus alkaliphilus TaxID=942866 RepID=UPI000DE648D2|nr:sigma factor-like helix-turn-helix DNA-binding protein [Cupriavidus alkaliphilus]PVY76120.1 RNA polymerase sigma factor (sigma-70 family) [Cupriavidus alkaliphilus]